MNPATYHHHTSNSALTNSFRGDAVPAYTAASPYAIPSDDRYAAVPPHHLGRQPSLESAAQLPTIDTTYSSNPASAYGSPRDEEASGGGGSNRFGLGLSPAAKGLSVLDAPLPASFDSNGISHAARYGPWPASVPSKFGLESPSHSLNSAKDARTSETLKLLHTSAFGSSDHLGQPGPGGGGGGAGGNDGVNGFSMAGSSPPVGMAGGTGGRLPGHATGGGPAEEYFGRRAMHSSSLRYAKPRLLSSSAPKFDQHEWEPEFLFEEDYVPGALANEVLTPAEKARRGSNANTLRGLDDVGGGGGESGGLGMSIAASPGAAGGLSSIKFGSPSGASPSRWGSLFQRQKEDEFSDLSNGSFAAAAAAAGSPASRPMKHAGSAFGHVGSPLRNSSLASAMGAELMNNNINNSSGSSPARPGTGSRSGSGTGESMSALTQQLRQTGLDGGGSDANSPHLHPSAATRNGSIGGPGTSVIGRERERDRALERHVSCGSMGSSGRFTTPIDEEDAAFVFSMEEEEEAASSQAAAAAAARSRKRVSVGAASPLGNGWSYASAAAAAAGKNGGGAPRSNGGAGARGGGGPSVGTVGGR